MDEARSGAMLENVRGLLEGPCCGGEGRWAWSGCREGAGEILAVGVEDIQEIKWARNKQIMNVKEMRDIPMEGEEEDPGKNKLGRMFFPESLPRCQTKFMRSFIKHDRLAC